MSTRRRYPWHSLARPGAMLFVSATPGPGQARVKWAAKKQAQRSGWIFQVWTGSQLGHAGVWIERIRPARACEWSPFVDALNQVHGQWIHIPPGLIIEHDPERGRIRMFLDPDAG